MTGIQVTSPEDKPTREQQIARITGAIPAEGQVRLRILVQILDEEKQYIPLRDASWMITIPKTTLRPDTVESLLGDLGTEIRALATTTTTASSDEGAQPND